jgi:hypothetical protein
MMATAASEYRLKVRVAGKTYSLDLQQAFHFGYMLVRQRRYRRATQVFDAMAHSGRSNTLATIMLAYCKALLKDYEATQDLLIAAFPGNRITVAEQLHTAFVYVSLGMWADAVAALSEVARQYDDLPIVCLLLGDLLASQGTRADAITCWRLAVARDHKDGAVASFVRQLVPSRARSHAKT